MARPCTSKMPHPRARAWILAIGAGPRGLPAAAGCGGGRARACAGHARGAQARRRASRTSPTSTPTRHAAAAWCWAQLGSFDSLNPFIIKGVAASRLREYVYESLLTRSRRRGLHPLRPDRREHRAATRPRLRHLPPAEGGQVRRRQAHHAGGRAVQPRGAEGEGLPLSPLALRQGGQGREGGRAQRALHLQCRRRPRGAAAPRADADPAQPQARRRQLRAHHPGAARSAAGLTWWRRWTPAAPSSTAATPTGGRAICP